METTQQRNSRISQDDAVAHSTLAHAKDFFAGLATYEIKPSQTGGFFVFQRTPHGQLCGDSRTIEEAEAKIENWKASEICCGYSRSQF